MFIEGNAPQVIDRMGAFWRFFEGMPGSSIDEKVACFKGSVLEPNFDLYRYVMGITDGALRDYIAVTEPQIDVSLPQGNTTLQRFNDNLAQFQRIFLALQPDFKIYLLPSLGLFKGMAVPCGDEAMLLLGMDALEVLNEHEFNSYITHELFHIYHYQQSAEVRQTTELAFQSMTLPPLWGLLFTEGLATHAIRILYPEIPEDEILDWRPLVAQAKPLLPQLVSEARRVLTSAAVPDIAGFFYFPRQGDASIPTGCGYYLGMLIAEILANRYGMQKLLQLEQALLVQAVDSALMELAKAS